MSVTHMYALPFFTLCNHEYFVIPRNPRHNIYPIAMTFFTLRVM